MDPTTPGTPIYPNTTPVPRTTVVVETRVERPPVPFKQRVREVQLKVEDYCRQDPVKALAIALVGGFVVGKLLKMAMHQGEDRELRRRRKALEDLRKRDRKFHQDFLADERYVTVHE